VTHAAGRGRALGALVLGGIFLGCSPILVRVSHIGPIATAFWRLALALLPLTAFFLNAGRTDTAGRMPATAGDYWTAALPGIFLAGDLAAWHISLHLTSVTNSTLFANMAPVIVTLASWLFLRQKISGAFIAGLALSVVGVIVLNGGSFSTGGGSHDSHYRGDAIALLAACFYAGYFVMLSRARASFSTAVVMLWSTVAAAICVLPMALVFEPAFVPHAIAGWVILLGLGWLVHAGGQGLITFSLAWLPPAFSSLTLLIQPVVAAVLARFILDEPLGLQQIAGGAVIIAGILLARRTA
jgi:drug/metabolite transporter (DMT)-like permease